MAKKSGRQYERFHAGSSETNSGIQRFRKCFSAGKKVAERGNRKNQATTTKEKKCMKK